MGIGMHVILMWSLVFFFPSAVYAREGEAVYYEPPYTPSACYQMQDKGQWVAGVRDELWENRAACGRRYRVKCTGAAFGNGNPCKQQQGTGVEVQVVDYCRAPCNGIINLSQDAFNKIADLKAGRIKVQFDQI
ncbi:hypothetical protein SLE2022_151250 [Rubroshorea leprosula]